MTYSKIFSPPAIHRIDVTQGNTLPAADKRGDIYFFSDELILAVNVALVTGRPLLLAGLPGSGKSTLARHVAAVLNWRYYAETITSQTRAQDLLYRLDLLKRLYDANTRREEATESTRARNFDDWKPYLKPGVLWWALRPDSASKYVSAEMRERLQDTRSESQRSHSFTGRSGEPSTSGKTPAVVLLDEIDKADPDVPNNLLQALGRLEFSVPELGEQTVIDGTPEAAPLIILTTNQERSLPDAFVRRCVYFRLSTPSQKRLLALAEAFFAAQFGEDGQFTLPQRELFTKLYADFQKLRLDKSERKPSTAELLDAVEVCLAWKVSANSPELLQIVKATVQKRVSLDDPASEDTADGQQDEEEPA